MSQEWNQGQLKELQAACEKVLFPYFNNNITETEIENIARLATPFDDAIGKNVDWMREYFSNFQRYKRRSDRERNLERCRRNVKDIRDVVISLLDISERS